MNVGEWIQNNGRLLAVILLGTVLVVEGTNANYPSLPEWTGLAVTAAVVVALAGWIAAGKIYAMLPEERGVFLVAFDGDPGGGKLWELSEDEFAELEVHNGQLYEWSEALHRTYEVRSYDRPSNTAVANFRETAPGSELVSHHTATQAMNQIAELREEFELQAEKAKHIRNRLPSIVRRLDRQRAKDQARSLEPHLAPSTDKSASITDILEESLPENLQPDYLQGDEAAQRATDDSGDGWASFDLLQDTEPLEAVGAGGTNNAVADD